VSEKLKTGKPDGSFNYEESKRAVVSVGNAESII
jgi:hypothetical protein